MEREEPNKDKCGCNIIVKPEKLILKANEITTVKIEEIKENIRLKI